MNPGLNTHDFSGIRAQQPPRRAGVSRRRSDIKIIADMLRVGEKGAGKTEIMYTANMSYSQIQKYLEYLVDQGFIHKVNLDSTMIAYQVTESGLNLLRAIDNLIAMLEPATTDSL
jgi:predicted transcriptional regulator